VRPAIGRLFTEDDDGAPGAHPVLVLSHGYWKRRFGSNPGIVNEKVNVNGHPMIVLGVTPPFFHGVLAGDTPDLLAPMAMKREITPTWYALDDREDRWLSIFARLKPGVRLPQAAAAMNVLYRSISEGELSQLKDPPSSRARQEFLNQKLELRPAAQGINSLRADWETPLVALMAMVGLVLLIACANVANLLLARAASRQKEMAIRLAIGASRWSIVRQLVIENLMVSIVGGLAGVLVAIWTTDALLLSIVTGLLFGLVPAIVSTRPDLSSSLKDQSANVTASGGQARFRRIFIVAQVALSLLLLVGAGLFARSLFNLMNQNPGFHAEKLLTFSVDPSLNGYDAPRGFRFLNLHS